MFRVMLSAGNIFISFVLGLLACAALIVYNSAAMDSLLAWAAGFKEWMVGLGLAPDYNIWFRIFLGEAQLVLMGFTIIARILVGAFLGAASWLFGFNNM